MIKYRWECNLQLANNQKHVTSGPTKYRLPYRVSIKQHYQTLGLQIDVQKIGIVAWKIRTGMPSHSSSLVSSTGRLIALYDTALKQYKQKRMHTFEHEYHHFINIAINTKYGNDS